MIPLASFPGLILLVSFPGMIPLVSFPGMIPLVSFPGLIPLISFPGLILISRSDSDSLISRPDSTSLIPRPDFISNLFMYAWKSMSKWGHECANWFICGYSRICFSIWLFKHMAIQGNSWASKFDDLLVAVFSWCCKWLLRSSWRHLCSGSRSQRKRGTVINTPTNPTVNAWKVATSTHVHVK